MKNSCMPTEQVSATLTGQGPSRGTHKSPWHLGQRFGKLILDPGGVLKHETTYKTKTNFWPELQLLKTFLHIISLYYIYIYMHQHGQIQDVSSIFTLPAIWLTSGEAYGGGQFATRFQHKLQTAPYMFHWPSWPFGSGGFCCMFFSFSKCGLRFLIFLRG